MRRMTGFEVSNAGPRIDGFGARGHSCQLYDWRVLSAAVVIHPRRRPDFFFGRRATRFAQSRSVQQPRMV